MCVCVCVCVCSSESRKRRREELLTKEQWGRGGERRERKRRMEGKGGISPTLEPNHLPFRLFWVV